VEGSLLKENQYNWFGNLEDLLPVLKVNAQIAILSHKNEKK